MSTIHHVCTQCFFEERRGFTFTGAIPTAERPRCPHCGNLAQRILRLSDDELSDAAEVAYDRTQIVVREPRWELLRHHVLSAVAKLDLPPARRRTDGIIEIPIRDALSLVIQPVVDHISEQEGCLLASTIFDAEDADPREVRQLLGEINEALGESSLLLGTLRDLYPLREPRKTVFYRRFVPRTRLQPESIASLVQWASRVSLYVNEAFSSFGFSPASLRFLRNLDMSSGAPETKNGKRDDWARVHTAGFGLLELDELLERTDHVRARTVDTEEARQHIVEFLKALELDTAAMTDAEHPDQLNFHYHGVNLRLAFLSDERDSYVRVTAHISSSVVLDEENERLLSTLSRGLAMGDVVLRPEVLEESERYSVVLQDTILGDDLNVDELSKILANVAHHAESFRDALGAGLEAQEPPRGAALDGLLNFISMRAMQQSRTPNLPLLTKRVCEFLGQLSLYPRLTAEGHFQVTYEDVNVTIHLGEVVPDSYLTIRAHLVDDLGVGRAEALRAVADLDVEPMLGGFHILDNGAITFEDTILGNSLDINELAKTLHEVVTVASRHRQTLRRALQADVTRAPEDGTRITRAIEGLAALYRRSYDDEERRRAIQALAMFDEPTARGALSDAIRDPAASVADFACAALVADVGERDAELIDAILDMALDTELSDAVRWRAIRVVGVARKVSSSATTLQKVALSNGETSSLRAFAFQALGALGSATAVSALVEGVRQPSHLVSHAALEAMVSLGLPDPAPLFAAAQEAVERLRNRDEHDRATIFRTIARLGMQETVLDLVDDDWERSAEVAFGLAEACATAEPPHLDTLREMLTHPRGEIRRTAYNAAGVHALGPLADELAEALLSESDESLKPVAIQALGEIGKFTRKVADALQRVSHDARLRQLAFDTMHRLRVARARAIQSDAS